MTAPVSPSPLASLSPRAWGWQLSGACVGGDPELWFAEEAAAAKAVCAGCSVRATCLADALSRGEAWGVLGGLDPDERRALAAARGFPRPSVRGVLPAHGRRAAYVAGCRCGACRRANSVYVASWRRDRPVPVTGGVTVVVRELVVPAGRGRCRAWPGQLQLVVEGAA